VSTARIVIPRAQGKQVEMMLSRRRFKVGRAGRRGGKTRVAFIAGVLGHGPTVDGKKLFKGFLDGGQICWIPPTIGQSRAIWREEIVPRFKGQPGFQIKEAERVVLGPNGGSLEILSYEQIDVARGRRFDGVIFDEGRDYDLDYAWNSVIRPTLVDRKGWAIFVSSTKAGSAFNRICEEVRDGIRNPELWEEFHWRTADNPVLDVQEIADIYAEYQGREREMQEELDALLLTGGAGLAFPEWNDSEAEAVHVAPRRVLPQSWRYVGAIDWGYVKGCYVLGAVGPEGHIEIVWEKILERTHARDAAKQVLQDAPWLPRPDYIAGDHQMWQDTGIASGTTIADEFLAGLLEASGGQMEQMPQLIPMRHGPGARTTSKNLIHKLLRWQPIRNPETGKLEPWAAPRLRVQQSCPYIRKSFRSLPSDPKKPEDVDTKADDHGYDAVRYLIGSVPEAPLVEPQDVAADVHPGYDVEARRRRETMHPWEQRMREATEGADQPYDVAPGGYWHPGADR
jgi:hypothetical protein